MNSKNKFNSIIKDVTKKKEMNKKLMGSEQKMKAQILIVSQQYEAAGF